MRLYFLDSLGWPVEYTQGRPVMKWIRRLIHTRKITVKKPECLG